MGEEGRVYECRSMEEIPVAARPISGVMHKLMSS